MDNLKIVLNMLVPFVFVIPLVHLVRSQYWTKQAKTIWAVFLVLGSVVGYAAFLVATYNKAKRQIQLVSSSRGTKNNWLSVSTFIVMGGRAAALLAAVVLTAKLFSATHNELMVLPWGYLAIFGYWLPVEILGNLILHFGARSNENVATGNSSP